LLGVLSDSDEEGEKGFEEPELMKDASEDRE